MKINRPLVWPVLIGLLSVLVLFFKASSPFGPLFWIPLSLFVLSLSFFFAALAVNLYKRKRLVFKFPALLSLLLSVGIALVFLLASWDYRVLLPFTPASEMTSEQWKADLDYFKSKFTSHPAYDPELDSLSENLFKDLYQNIGALSRDDYLREIMKLVGLFKDGHSFFFPFQVFNCSKYLPIKGHYFEDGFYILDTADEYDQLKNKKLLGINGQGVEQIFQSIQELTGPENIWNAKSRFNLYLFSVNTLYSLDIISDPRSVTLSYLDEDNNKKNLQLGSEPFINWAFWAYKPIEEGSPAAMNIHKPNFQLKQQENSLFLEMNLIENNSEANTISQMATELDSILRTNQVHRLIIDLRNNTGGNNQLYRPILDAILKNEYINQNDRLLVLTSRTTFSAGVNFADDLRVGTEARFVGEPTGAGPRHYGDAQVVTLPESGLFFFLSTKLWAGKDSTDKRNTILPDVEIKYYFGDYFNQRDPWMEAVDSISQINEF